MKDVYSSPSMKDGHGKNKDDAFDFFHINSIDKTESGDYIVSARYMLAVICVSGKTGEILWQLGGKNNNFKDLDHALNFAWQHHGRAITPSHYSTTTPILFSTHHQNTAKA